MEFRLLGPLEVRRSGADVPISAGKLRALLGSLLLDANVAVPADRLIDVMWDGRPPASATPSLHNHVMRLRRQLGDEGGTRIRAVALGYLIQVEAGELDLDVFSDLCEAGRRAAQAEQWPKASANLADALALWRGSPLADIASLQQDARIRELVEARSQAFEGRIEADLEQGRHQEVITELRALIEEQPLREAFHGQLMLALYRTGRQSEALEVFQDLRSTLVDRLGVEPSSSIRQLHGRILDADPKLAIGASARSGPLFQLPADTRVFTGREHELGELMELVRAAPEGTEAGMVVISAIDGMAGIGKTALAVHAAHRVREQFPDGQLFLDLRGYTTDLEPLTTGDAMDWFLRSLGVPPQSIPKDLGERAAFYRDRLDGTRTLIILDNASSAAQVRPLLPRSPGCLVLITSRRRLTGLDDAHSLALDILPDADAVALLHRVAGPGRVPGHNPAILELIALCGHMPLAIQIAAARLRRNPALRVENVVAQLRDDSRRLDQFQDEDRDLTAVFDLSYQDLPEAERRLLRLLGLAPGPDFDVYAAANLAGIDHRTAERLLESLLDHNLLTQRTPGRYQFHDLVRLYAHALGGLDPVAERDRALDRLSDYYQHAAQKADHHLARQTRPGPPRSAPTPTTAPELRSRTGALAWLRGERANLLATLAQAAAQAETSRVIALTAALAAFLHQEGPWLQVASLHQAAAAAAHEGGDRQSEANALWDLARVRQLTGDLATSAGLLEQSLAVYQELGDRQGEANALWDLARSRSAPGHFPAAVEMLERALAIYQDLGDRRGEANAAFELGRLKYVTGSYPAAVDLYERALAGYQELGDELGQANSFFDLGRLRQLTGDFPVSADLQERALAMYRSLGQRLGEADALRGAGRGRQVTGDYAAATDLLGRALTIYQSLGHRLGEAYSFLGLGRARQAVGEFPAAADLIERALAIFQGSGNTHGLANARLELGCARRATGDHPASADLLGQALKTFHDLGDRQGEAEALNGLGALAAVSTGPREALDLYRRALQIAREVSSPLDEARALEGAARAAASIGDRAAALSDLHEAVAIYRRIGAAEAGTAGGYLVDLENETRLSG